MCLSSHFKAGMVEAAQLAFLKFSMMYAIHAILMLQLVLCIWPNHNNAWISSRPSIPVQATVAARLTALAEAPMAQQEVFKVAELPALQGAQQVTGPGGRVPSVQGSPQEVLRNLAVFWAASLARGLTASYLPFPNN